MGFLGRYFGCIPLGFSQGEVVSTDRIVSPTRAFVCLSWDRAECALHGQSERGSKVPGPASPHTPTPDPQPWGMSPHTSLRAEMLQQGSHVKSRLFSFSF